MKDRLRQLREKLGMSRSDFAALVNISASSIESYEYGRRSPSQSQIEIICQKTEVNKEWLRTGEGEMFNSVSESKDIARFMGQVMKDTPDAFRRRLIEILAAMTPDEWALMERKAREILGETKED